MKWHPKLRIFIRIEKIKFEADGKFIKLRISFSVFFVFVIKMKALKSEFRSVAINSFLEKQFRVNHFWWVSSTLLTFICCNYKRAWYQLSSNINSLSSSRNIAFPSRTKKQNSKELIMYIICLVTVSSIMKINLCLLIIFFCEVKYV